MGAYGCAAPTSPAFLPTASRTWASGAATRRPISFCPSPRARTAGSPRSPGCRARCASSGRRAPTGRSTRPPPARSPPRGWKAAATLSPGEQRQLEIAMTLATDPDVLLLDEPLAGMGAEESERMVELLRRLRATHSILLVEHDMDAVFSLADRLTVMVSGTVLAGGSPDEIRANPAVQEAYLGTEAAHD